MDVRLLRRQRLDRRPRHAALAERQPHLLDEPDRRLRTLQRREGRPDPVEWGRKLLWMPGPPNDRDADQERVWHALSRVA